MADPIPTFIPSTPDPQIVTLVASILRWGLTILSAAGVTWAATASTSTSTLTAIATALVGLGGAIFMLVWSLRQKAAAAQADHDGSVQSAKTGIPTRAT